MKSLLISSSLLLWIATIARSSPATYDGGYVKCTDGSSPQKDASGQTLACQGGQQSYTPCQTGFECMTPLAGRPGVCCKIGYGGNGGGGGGGGETVAPPPVAETAAPPPVAETAAPPPVSETLAPPPPETAAPPLADTTLATAPTLETESTGAPPAPEMTTVQGGEGGGVEVTPPPPAPIDSSATTTMASGGSMDTTTTGMDSVDVVTDGTGGAVVSPNSVAQNKKGNHTVAASSAADIRKAPKPAVAAAKPTPTTTHKPYPTKPTVTPVHKTPTATPQAAGAKNGTRPNSGRRFSDHV